MAVAERKQQIKEMKAFFHDHVGKRCWWVGYQCRQEVMLISKKDLEFVVRPVDSIVYDDPNLKITWPGLKRDKNLVPWNSIQPIEAFSREPMQKLGTATRAPKTGGYVPGQGGRLPP